MSTTRTRQHCALDVSATAMGAIVVSLALAMPRIATGQESEALRAELERLRARIEQLEQREAAADSARAEQSSVSSGGKKVRLELSGQVNRGALFVDNGDESDVFSVDNDNSSTRIRLIGSGELNDDITVGTQIEVQFESNSTAAIRIDQDSPAGPNNFTERKLELFVDSKKLGRLWFGQGDTASNGSSEKDLSGTTVVGYSGVADLAGGIAFQDGGTLGPRINQVSTNLDGLSRDDRIRYDTPALAGGGLKLSTSYVDGGSFDVAGHFSGDFQGTRVGTALAYANANSRQGFEQFNGSVSVLTPIGVSLTAAAGTRTLKENREDPTFWYAKLGYTARPLSYGATSVAVDYQVVEDLQAEGDEFTSIGALLVQNFDQIGTELYLGVRNHELDRPGADFDDILAVLTGARIKF